MAKNTVQQFRFCFCTNISKETNHFPVAIGTAVGAHTHTHPHAQQHACQQIYFSFHMLELFLHKMALKNVREACLKLDLVSVSLLLHLHLLHLLLHLGSLTCSWWPSCSGLLRLDGGLILASVLARKEDSATGEVALQASGRLHVNAQYYRVSQVVSGVCGGRVRGEAAGLIGRRDPGRRLLFAVRGVLPSWVGMLPRRVMTSGSGTSALSIYRFDLILPVFIAFKKKKRR